jgi:hypothetical protein
VAKELVAVQSIGMTAVLIVLPGEVPMNSSANEEESWTGARIAELGDLVKTPGLMF